MGKGAVWAFAFGAIIVTIIAAFIQNKLAVGGAVQAGVNLGLFGTMAYFGVYLTKASKGQGIVAFLVSSLVFSVALYFVTSMLLVQATSELTTQTGAIAGASAADTARVAQAAGGAIGALAGIFVGVIAFVVSFLAGLIGCLIGGSAKNKALAAA